MDDLLTRMWREITARPEGPLAARFYLQPLVATLLAVRDGIKDASAGRPAFFWAIFTNRAQRRELLRNGWRGVRRVFLASLAVDVIYQLAVLKAVRPVEGLLVAFTLAILPYVLLRGPTNRITRRARRIGAGGEPDRTARRG